MTYNITIATPTLIAGQEFRVRIRDYPSGSFGATTVFTTNTLTFTGLTTGQYEVEVIFYNGSVSCEADYIVFATDTDTVCPTFSSTILSNGVSFWLRVTWSGIVGYPSCGYIVYWAQGAASGTLAYPTALPTVGFIDIPLPNSTPVSIFITSDNCSREKKCYDTVKTYTTPCIDLAIGESTVNLSNPANGIWTITLYITQSIPATLSSLITYVQTNGGSAGSVTVSLSPTATTTSFTVLVISFTGLRPTFKGTMVDRCGNAISWVA